MLSAILMTERGLASNSYTSLFDLLNDLPPNKVVCESMVKAWSHINNPNYGVIVCAVSGGSDSDIMMDICSKCDRDRKIKYVWFDTGLEYQATKNHIQYLKKRYGVDIRVCKPLKSIPTSCRKYGVPFLSKTVSEYIYRLQRYHFQFEDDTYEDLVRRYPNCRSALMWWCGRKGAGSHFNIQQNKWLKEFMVLNPPDFKISAKCCWYSKKAPSKKLYHELGCDLDLVAVRKAEGGARAGAYKGCFDDNSTEMSHYRPLFWYSDADKADYEKAFDVRHSDCYRLYGLPRTGCVGCPCGRNITGELEVIMRYEPRLYKAVMNTFGESYAYTWKYHAFCREMDLKYGSYRNYLRKMQENCDGQGVNTVLKGA